MIPLADCRPALVVARRWASAAPAASLESAGAYLHLGWEWVGMSISARIKSCPLRCARLSGLLIEHLQVDSDPLRSVCVFIATIGGRAANLCWLQGLCESGDLLAV